MNKACNNFRALTAKSLLSSGLPLFASVCTQLEKAMLRSTVLTLLMLTVRNGAVEDRARRAMTTSELETVKTVHAPSGSVLGFSPLARGRLDAEVQQYRASIARVAREIADSEHVDSISERHVCIASHQMLNRSDHRPLAAIGAIGGVALGIGSSVAAQLLRGPLSSSEVLIAILACTIGAALISALWVLERSK